MDLRGFGGKNRGQKKYANAGLQEDGKEVCVLFGICMVFVQKKLFKNRGIEMGFLSKYANPRK